MSQPTTPSTTVDPDPTTARPTRHVGGLIAITLLVGVAWNLVGNLLLPSAWYVPANLAVAAGLVALARWWGLSWPRLGLARADVVRGVVIGLLATIVIAAVIGVGLLLPFVEEALRDDTVRDDTTAQRWYVPLVRIPLGTAVFEEILFRSVLFGALSCLMRTWKAVAVSSILFGLWHIVPSWETADADGVAVVGIVVGTVLVTAVGGVLFALLRTWSRSVVAPVLAHWATNSLTYTAALIALESS